MEAEAIQKRLKNLVEKGMKLRKAQKQCDRYQYPTSTDRNTRSRLQKEFDDLLSEEQKRLYSQQKEMF